MSKALPKRSDDYSAWYNELVKRADLAENSEGPWTQAIITTRVSHTFTGLTPGTKYWVKVRAVGTSGFGLWSDPACKMAA